MKNHFIHLLNSMGYELSGIGGEILPAALTIGGRPIGFLTSDFTMSFIDSFPETDKIKLQNAMDYIVENDRLEVDQNYEQQLGSFDQVYTTVSFDINEGQPIYKVYRQTGQEPALITSSYEKEEALRLFAQEAGLSSGENVQQPVSDKEAHLKRFFEEIAKKGFEVKEGIKNSMRQFVLLDGAGNEAGYVDFLNRVTMCADNPDAGKKIMETYRKTSTVEVEKPGLLKRLGGSLSQIGLLVRARFAKDGVKYSIYDGNKRVAEVAGDKGQEVVRFEEKATERDKSVVTKVMNEMEKEMKRDMAGRPGIPEPQNQQNHAQGKAQIQADQNIAGTSTEVLGAGKPEQPVPLAPQDIPPVNQPPLQTPPDFPPVEQPLPQTPLDIPPVEPPVSQSPPEIPAAEQMRQPLTPNQQKIAEDFYKLDSLKASVLGFNQVEFDRIESEMMGRFGTVKCEEFEQRLWQGEYTPGSLSDKLSQATSQAQRQNEARQPTANVEKQQERSQ